MVAAISGCVVRHAAFDSNSERLVAVGTIGHAIRNGTVHMWGTGLDAQRCPGSPNPAPYQRPAGTEFHVHAVRGPKTGAVLRAQGIAVPEIYGDPVYLLPKFWPMDHVVKTHEIGVIVHLTELASQDPAATVLDVMTRYGIPPSARVTSGSSTRSPTVMRRPCAPRSRRSCPADTSSPPRSTAS